jgi:hypothetical protein
VGTLSEHQRTSCQTPECRQAEERQMSDNETQDARQNKYEAWHFFIYDVLYVAVLGAILYDLLKGPEGSQEDILRYWYIEWSLAVTYAVDCLHTRAHLDSFDKKTFKPEDFLNTGIPIAFGYAFSRAIKGQSHVAFGVMTGIVVLAFITNLKTRKDERRLALTLGLDGVLFFMYLLFAINPEWFDSPGTAWRAWLPPLVYAAYAFFGMPNPRHAPNAAQKPAAGAGTS